MYSKMTDREIDVLVAQKLFGLDVQEVRHGYITAGNDTLGPGNKFYVYKGFTFSLPYYASEGDPMMLVVERMIERGWRLNLNTDHNLVTGWHGWTVFFSLGEYGEKDFRQVRASADTLPRAVCEAALKAVKTE